jgi:hypothetical protein
MEYTERAIGINMNRTNKRRLPKPEDGLDASATPGVRRIITNRTRYAKDATYAGVESIYYNIYKKLNTCPI